MLLISCLVWAPVRRAIIKLLMLLIMLILLIIMRHSGTSETDRWWPGDLLFHHLLTLPTSQHHRHHQIPLWFYRVSLTVWLFECKSYSQIEISSTTRTLLHHKTECLQDAQYGIIDDHLYNDYNCNVLLLMMSIYIVYQIININIYDYIRKLEIEMYLAI